MNARDELADLIEDAVDYAIYNGADAPPSLAGIVAHHAAAAILAEGYRKPRVVNSRDEANALPDRSVILTPGMIVFQKWEGWYGEGKDAWEREMGQAVPAELLSNEGHFPATVLYEPEAAA